MVSVRNVMFSCFSFKFGFQGFLWNKYFNVSRNSSKKYFYKIEITDSWDLVPINDMSKKHQWFTKPINISARHYFLLFNTILSNRLCCYALSRSVNIYTINNSYWSLYFEQHNYHIIFNSFCYRSIWIWIYVNSVINVKAF